MSDFYHVGIAYIVGGRIFVIDAIPPNIRIFPISQLLPFYLINTTYRLDFYQEEQLLKKVGMPYSYWEALKSAFSTDTDGQNSWQCAKLVNQTLKDFDPGFDQLKDTPGNIVKYLLERKNFSITYVG